MDLQKFFQLIVIVVFSAAIALMGLNELSHRFVQAGPRHEGGIPADKLVKELRGEIDMAQPLAARPTPDTDKSRTESPRTVRSTGKAAYGAVQNSWKKLLEKLLP